MSMVGVSESLFIRSILKKPVERTPVWLMRQAGRYLPEYRAVRQKAGDFLSLCKNPQLACEVTLQPLRRFQLDAAILFSDILTIPDAMGLGLQFAEGEGPYFSNPIQSLADIKALSGSKAIDRLGYVVEAVKLIRQNLPENLPLIGFSGSPWTLACYMTEGKAAREFKTIKQWMYKVPGEIHQLLETLSLAVTSYLAQQVEAGVNALMLFDTWGGILTTSAYQAFSLDYMKRIIQTLKQNYPTVPIIIFTKGGGLWLSEMVESGCDALGLDWTCELGFARSRVGSQVALQGNLDPAILTTSPSCIRAEVQRILASYGQGSGHVFNLGHGITPDVPPDNVAVLIEAVKELSPDYHYL